MKILNQVNMKSRLLLLIASFALLFSFDSFAQNTFPSCGNVGIGTTSPQASLSLGATGGKRLLVYDGGVAWVQSGFGIDMSGTGRELSLFLSTSNGSDGNMSFGRRLESSGVYTELMRLQ